MTVHFTYARASSVEDATRSGARHTSQWSGDGAPDFIAGGTDLLQLLRERVRDTPCILDITGLDGLADVTVDDGGIRLGALVRMADAAAHPVVRAEFPVVAEALLASASPQVRNQATLGGNLLQRTRCGYFRDAGSPCNKRRPGSGCPALQGRNRMHAVLGTSEHCIATYAGDLAVALVALDADVETASAAGRRTVAVADLHRPPGSTPHVETQLHAGEVITAVRIPFGAAARRSHYLKVRDRASFEWAVASAAVALDLDGAGVVRAAGVAVGGVATTPWRLRSVEAALLGRRLDLDLCRAAAASAADGAVTHGENAYKPSLVRRTVARALAQTGGLR